MRGPATAVVPTLGASLLLCLAAEAWAGSDPAAEARPPVRRAEILLDMDDAATLERDETGSSFRIRKRYGFEYAHRFDSESGPPLIFSIQGPALPSKRFGLSFEIRF